MHKHLKLAFEFVKLTDYHPSMKQQLAAVLVSGGSILGHGVNSVITNSFVHHYTDRVHGKRDYYLTTHAEMTAVKSVRNKVDLRGSKIFVARRRYDNNKPGMARPCEVCQEVLRSYGIKRAYYTIDEDNYGIMKFQGSKIIDTVISCHDLVED